MFSSIDDVRAETVRTVAGMWHPRYQTRRTNNLRGFDAWIREANRTGGGWTATGVGQHR
jgi:hypothetical protein